MIDQVTLDAHRKAVDETVSRLQRAVAETRHQIAYARELIAETGVILKALPDPLVKWRDQDETGQASD